MTTDATYNEMTAEVPALVIHVRSAKERETFVEGQLKAVGLPFVYISDGDIADLTPQILDRYFANDGLPDTMHGPFPRTSCAYKHVLAMQYIVEKSLRGALVVEDDVYFLPTFKRLFAQSMTEADRRFAHQPLMINYEESSLMLVPRSQRVKGQLLYEAGRDRFTGCYYINSEGAQAFLHYLSAHPMALHIDHFHTLLTQEGVLHYCWSHPCMACQCSADGSMPTLIPTRKRPLKRLKWFFKRYYKHLLYNLR